MIRKILLVVAIVCSFIAISPAYAHQINATNSTSNNSTGLKVCPGGGHGGEPILGPDGEPIPCIPAQ
jgi:hypothetical protein